MKNINFYLFLLKIFSSPSYLKSIFNIIKNLSPFSFVNLEIYQCLIILIEFYKLLALIGGRVYKRGKAEANRNLKL